MPNFAIYHPERFTTGTRILILTGRNKDGVEKRTITKVAYESSEFLPKLMELIECSRPGERVYASLAARNVCKAIRLFKQKQLDADYTPNPLEFYYNLENAWVSALMDKTAQVEKLWLFDCDNAAEIRLVEQELSLFYDRPESPYWYETKNGAHCIVQAFNRSLITDAAQKLIKENPLMLWSY